MKNFGIALIVLGVIALLYGGISYNRERTVLEIGDLKATTTERKNLPVSPIFGVISIVVGTAMVLIPRRKLQVG